MAGVIVFTHTTLSSFRSARSSGFTLIEMLLAITIFSMVVGIIFTSFRLGSSSWEKGEQDLERIQKIRVISELLYKQIHSCFPYTLTPGELDTHVRFYAFFGEPDSLKFVTTASLRNTRRGLSFVEFWAKEGQGLMAGEELAIGTNLTEISLQDEDRAIVIDPDVTDIKFRFFDRQKKDETGEWVIRWNPRDKINTDLRLPRAVEVSLTFDVGKGRTFAETLVIPIITDVFSTFFRYGK